MRKVAIDVDVNVGGARPDADFDPVLEQDQRCSLVAAAHGLAAVAHDVDEHTGLGDELFGDPVAAADQRAFERLAVLLNQMPVGRRQHRDDDGRIASAGIIGDHAPLQLRRERIRRLCPVG